VITRITVIVPAANEEATIQGCLSALRAAASGVACPVRIVVVLDGCTDGTAEEVAGIPDIETVITSARNVGHARQVGAAHALRDDMYPGRHWLANTDADSKAPADWLSRTVELSRSADVVLGTVTPNADLPASTRRAWFDRHTLRDGHPHIHGANFGIRASAYLALGGWRPLVTGEDVDLAQRAITAGLRVHRTARSAVRTSTRTNGRAPQGFSSYVAALRQA
jgi:glycosyltransferase involved in cell wall biosynthesis